MPLTKKGAIEDFYADGVAIQPNYTLTENNDGSIEGQVTFKCDESKIGNLPQIGTTHPRDTRVECYTRELTYLPRTQIRLTAYYFGLVASKTDEVISFTPQTNQDTITSHPDFADFAGTSESPLNGAVFDESTGEFLGFFDPASPDVFGVEAYLTPATLVSSSYWTRNVPSLKKQMSIHTNVSGFRKPDDVKEFLLLSTPYRQIGSHYQVTEQYMGSGPGGFSRTIYPQD